MLKNVVLLSITILLGTNFNFSRADVVTFSFTGSITSITENNMPVFGIGGIDLGDAFSGSFRYDTANASSDLNGAADTGLYRFNVPAVNSANNFVTVNIDSKQFGTPNTFAGVLFADMRNNVTSNLSTTSDLFIVRTLAPTSPAGWSTTGPALTVAYIDPSGTAFSNDSLPTSFSITPWQQGVVLLSFGTATFPGGSASNVNIEGTITIAAIPEPSAILLFGTAGGSLLLFVRRKKPRKNWKSAAAN